MAGIWRISRFTLSSNTRIKERDARSRQIGRYNAVATAEHIILRAIVNQCRVSVGGCGADNRAEGKEFAESVGRDGVDLLG
jgi:hypothetical protein